MDLREIYGMTRMTWARVPSELIDRARGGDAAALTAILTETYPSVLRRVAARLPIALATVVDAEDVLQEAHVAAFRHIATLQSSDPETFQRWLGAIALYKLRRAIRTHLALKRGGGQNIVRESALDDLLSSLSGPGLTGSRTMARREEAADALREAIGALPADCAAALRLVYFEGHSVAEAARQMGRTPRAVHNLCFKGRQRLRKLLPGQCPST